MPDLRTHLQVSVPTGAVSALWCSNGQDPICRILETAGGAFGGALGGLLPDCVDLPTSSYHRSGAHGIVPALVVGNAAVQLIGPVQGWLRERAQSHAEVRVAASSLWEQIWHLICEAVLRLLAGAVAGFPSGYVSHLTLDFFTPRSLPLVC